mmetsp:Transcript_2070/g.4748  ORF Transcript_2070/g.4748 Transcript_2070/m.4748 type:complete len:208 (-) Transcript_2070:900-1523(-)
MHQPPPPCFERQRREAPVGGGVIPPGRSLGQGFGGSRPAGGGLRAKRRTLCSQIAVLRGAPRLALRLPGSRAGADGCKRDPRTISQGAAKHRGEETLLHELSAARSSRRVCQGAPKGGCRGPCDASAALPRSCRRCPRDRSAQVHPPFGEPGGLGVLHLGQPRPVPQALRPLGGPWHSPGSCGPGPGRGPGLARRGTDKSAGRGCAL